MSKANTIFLPHVIGGQILVNVLHFNAATIFIKQTEL